MARRSKKGNRKQRRIHREKNIEAGKIKCLKKN